MAGYKPKVIALTKPPGQSFGFFLRVEQGEDGHLIRSLEMGGPAELSGLRDGDRVLRVNGTYVDTLIHSQVVDMVKESGVSVTFHVLDADSYQKAKADGVDLSDPQPRPAQNQNQSQPAMNGVAGQTPKPKLCYLVKTSVGYGFSLLSAKTEPGVFMTDVTPGGVAEKAGVTVRDRIVEINGENLESATHEAMVEKIKTAGSSILFLLVGEDTDRYYKNKRIAIGAGLATIKHLPLKPRIADLTKGPEGYGYFLTVEPKMKGHYIKDIDRGSPAERAGLKEMDRLVAVEGQQVDSCSHEQVVETIKKCGNKSCLLVVDAETDRMYKLGGVSPLLFWEESRESLLPPSYPDALTMPTPARAPSPATVVVIPAVVEKAEVKPKLCRMEKTSAGYGFHLNGIQGVGGQYIKEVVPGGTADRAGLEDEDLVIEVNGVNVERSDHEEVVELIKTSGSVLELLVADKKTYDQLKARDLAISSQFPAPASTPPPASSPSPAAPASPPSPSPNTREVREEEDTKAARPDTPPVQTRERTVSVSSSSSDDSIDERL
ncbi:Na(+)/H(+) exchange regulatory cofactor NHE-RF3 [Osmerus mordax]|uniref:Na(+)/H(+) exchange regulatory cofactor NHE-RF3 n=1 Tax=Osmerus mordax TaxID=8014 RepID=UPI00350EDD3C